MLTELVSVCVRIQNQIPPTLNQKLSLRKSQMEAAKKMHPMLSFNKGGNVLVTLFVFH